MQQAQISPGTRALRRRKQQVVQIEIVKVLEALESLQGVSEEVHREEVSSEKVFAEIRQPLGFRDDRSSRYRECRSHSAFSG